MTLLIGISGSLRRHSFNAGLLRAAQASAPAGTRLEIAPIADIPLYNADVEEAEGIPPSVTALKEAIAAADGLLLATPEYNNGIPGVFKNAIDWASRPPADIARIFAAKPVAMIGASPGSFGTILAQNAWLPVLRTLGAQLWTGGRLMVPHAAKAFDAEGNLIDETVRTRLGKFIADFVASLG
ncbi:NADPH-dependent FMN reductase [Sphingomonas oleivorans]|uniref:NADPH-dependent FMN reductase n=1 Tax=Sphingomonas oleivorans TaxID=1735121 RepID=A0A2T5G231_9SPHN|nr:NADPH-dependent FMN reductase [Sphingomonas oleivorans]PTQ13180.1 NADPH-dependent FMN reductase [Sphingomonas oleivorans]